MIELKKFLLKDFQKHFNFGQMNSKNIFHQKKENKNNKNH